MTFLHKVILEKREEVKVKKRQNSLEGLKNLGLRFKKRPFFEIFNKRFPKEVKIIAEIKMASPSGGVLAEHILPRNQAMVYEKGGAYSISVITEKKYFNGSMEFMTEVRDAVELPVLRKDFIVDIYEIYESKAIGADGVLLIADAIDRELLLDCLEVAREVDIDCLVEIHDLKTYENIADLKGFILGINNRDLKTLEVDLLKGYEMLNYIPNDTPVIIESGIERKEDIVKFMEKGVSGFLIGTVLMKAKNPLEKIRTLSDIYERKD